MNTVYNFACHGVTEVRKGLSGATVPLGMPAKLAAQVAELNGFDVLLVQDESGETKGAFFPDYLREHLPLNSRVSHIFMVDGVGNGFTTDRNYGGSGVGGDLASIIGTIDFHLPDFHSEEVNISPDVRVCKVGPHVVAGNPCPKHHTPTDPY